MSLAILRVVILPVIFVVGLMHEISNESLAADGSTSEIGSLTGRFLYDGAPPEPKAVSGYQMYHDGHVEELPSAHLILDNNLTDESLLVGPERGIANIVVWVRSKDIPRPIETNHQDPTIKFVKGHLEPHIVTLFAPGKISLENDEKEKCNIGGMPQMNEMWNRALLPNERFTVDVKQAEPVPARISGNMQPWFAAYLLVRPNPYFAVSDKEGRFKIENLPPGEWEFQVWQERCGPSGYLQTKDWPKGRFKMEIAAGDNNLGEIKLSPALFHEAVEAMP